MTDSGLVTPEQRRSELEAARDANTVDAQLLQLDLIREVGTLDGGALQRWVVRVPLYPKHQYVIKGASRNTSGYGKKADSAGWVSEYSAGIRAEGYDKLNKVAGIRFFTPETVHDRDGKEVPNPIHARDYLYHREVGQGYSETGQMVLYVEDIEIDFRLAWEAERLKKLQALLKSKSKGGGGGGGYDEEPPPWEEEAPATAKQALAAGPEDQYLLRDADGMPRMAENGGFLFHLPEKMEAEAMQRISTLRNFGGRQARTICRRRILQQALALRTLWTVEEKNKPELSTQWVWVTAWRDQMTADEALEKAKEEAKQVFGAPVGSYVHAEVKPEELDDLDEEVIATVVEEDDIVVDGDTGEVVSAPITDADRARAKAQAGTIPGVTVGMPGEKLSRAVCAARDVVGPSPCTREPGHCPAPHRSEDGVWPCEPGA